MHALRISLQLAAVALGTCALALISVDFAHAQGSFVPLAPAPSGSRLGQIYTSNSLTAFINGLFTAAIAVGAILAVMRLAFAGYLYMTTDAWGQKGKAKEVIGDVIMGLLLLLSIWLILRQINPKLLDLDILQSLKPSPQLIQPAQGTTRQPTSEPAANTDTTFNGAP